MGTISIGTSIILGLWFYFIRSPWVPYGLWFHTAYRPLVSGLFVGIVMGDAVQGTIIGAYINLIYMGHISAGGAAPADPSLAGVMGTALALASGLTPEQALVLATPIGILGGMFNTVRMTINSAFPHRMEIACCEEVDIRKMTFWHIVPPQIVQFITTFPIVFLACYFGAPFVEGIVEGIPANVMGALTLVGTMLPAMGICLNLDIIAKKETFPFFFLGFFAVMYFGLNVIGVTVFGVIIAIVRFVSMNARRPEMAQETKNDEPILQAVPAEGRVKLNKKDVRHAFSMWRWFAFSCYNYETMQAMGFAQSMVAIMRKLYPNDDTFKHEMKRHFAFFNTEPHVGCVVHGVTIAMEEQRANGAPISGESISAVKTGLMGPLAGIGDTITQGITTPIMLAIGISMAQEGNVMGPVVFVVLNAILLIGMAYSLWMYGYRLGSVAVERLIAGGLMQQLMLAAGTLGCMVLGALVSTTVKVACPITFSIGASQFALQADLFDKIIPGLLPLLFTLFVFMLVRKKWSPNKILLVILAVGLIGGIVGIFA